MVNAEKNLSVETLRGIAILLVVVGHVVGSGPGGGMKIDFPHPLRYLYVWIDYIQMPLFTAIAGWAYALKPFSASSGEMAKRYGFIYVDYQDDGTGDGKRLKKDSFYWYKKVIATNGEDLT